MSDLIPIGISSCLLGNCVRYDGGHQHDRFITETLGQYFSFVPVCPEVECGLGVPREAMRLTGDPAHPRLVTIKTGIDHTDRMLTWAADRVRQLERDGLQGFLFKSRSPSSGMERVKVYGPGNHSRNIGVGLFARAFIDHFPLLPVEEDGRLHNIRLRENFIERLFVLQRWRRLKAENSSRGGLVAFHTGHKLLILAHSEKHYRAMGKLVAQTKTKPIMDLFTDYEAMLTAAFALKTTVKKHVNVLDHMLGYFKKMLSGAEKQEMLHVIDQYRKEYVPLIVPVTLLNYLVRKYGVEYLAGQYYLHPHPMELKLRNHS